MELYIFRHGEKNKDSYFIGHTDVALTERGQRQNEEIAKKLRAYKVEKVFTSDLERTFVRGGVQQKALREINFGTWENLTWAEIEKKYPSEFAQYLSEPLNFCFPGGESYQVFQKRILDWIKNLQKKKFRKVGIVTHQGAMRVLLSHLKGKDFWKIQVKNGKGIKLSLPRKI